LARRPALARYRRAASQAEHVEAEVDYFGPWIAVTNLLGLIPEAGDVFELVGSALEITAAATETATGEKPRVFQHTFAQVLNKVTSLQQEARDAITRHRRFATGDYGLLNTVGGLVASQTWTLDRQAAVSLGRRAFTRWVYESFLPVLWDRWSVSRCTDQTGSKRQCIPPRNTRLVRTEPGAQWRGKPTINFDGLVPKQSPCIIPYCKWVSLEDSGYRDVVNTLVGPVTDRCRYDAPTGRAWQYGTCTLGIPAAEILKFNAPWNGADHHQCDYFARGYGIACDQDPTFVVRGVARDSDSTALQARVGPDGDQRDTVTLRLRRPVPRTFDLRGARVRSACFTRSGAHGSWSATRCGARSCPGAIGYCRARPGGGPGSAPWNRPRSTSTASSGSAIVASRCG
jgi:hypothetical protein